MTVIGAEAKARLAAARTAADIAGGPYCPGNLDRSIDAGARRVGITLAFVKESLGRFVRNSETFGWPGENLLFEKDRGWVLVSFVNRPARQIVDSVDLSCRDAALWLGFPGWEEIYLTPEAPPK